jgi:hypothetical protein
MHRNIAAPNVFNLQSAVLTRIDVATAKYKERNLWSLKDWAISVILNFLPV